MFRGLSAGTRACDDPGMKRLLDDYRALLAEADRWFARCQQVLPEEISCSAGCTGCCRGLFDITLLDAALLRDGFERLPAPLQEAPRVKAATRLAALQSDWPGFGPPWILNLLPDTLWTEMPEDDSTPCPLLGADGGCLVYAYRPLTCRLHGLPQVDTSGFVFADGYCSRNFRVLPPQAYPQLRHDFETFFQREFALQHRFATALLGVPLAELDTFIPAALHIDFTGFDWQSWGVRHISRLTRSDKNI